MSVIPLENCRYRVSGICNKTYALTIEAHEAGSIASINDVDDSCLPGDLEDYRNRNTLTPEVKADSRCPLVNPVTDQVIYIRNIQVNPQPSISSATSPIS